MDHAEPGTLAEQIAYERVLAACSRDLLSRRSGEDPIHSALGRLLTVAGTSRIYLFENHEDPVEGLCTSQTHEVVAPGVSPQIDNPRLQNVRWRDGFSRWVEEMSAGRPISGLVEALPDSEREVLDAQDIVSILALPINVDGQWYGFIGFDDTVSSRHWSEDEVRLLRMAADMIGAYVERRRAEHQVRFQAQLLDSVRESVAATDLAGRVIYWGKGAERLYGYRSNEVMGRPLPLPPGEGEEAAQQRRVRQVIDSGSWRGEQLRRRKDGTSFWTDTSSSLVSDEEGRPTGMIAIDRDSTTRRRAQQTLLQYQRRLRDTTSELAIVEERQRRQLASVLHDTIGQTLFAIKTRLALLRKREELARDPEFLDGVVALADETLQDARTLTFELCPPMLYELGLIAALRWLVQRFEKRHDIACRLSADGAEPPLDDDVRGLLFQSVRELLTNVAKHARARNVTVSVAAREGELSIDVRDDGVGLDLSPPSRGEEAMGFGLFNLRERLLATGGKLTVRSEPDVGCCVTAAVPLRDGIGREETGA